MDTVTVLACSVNAAALLAQLASFYAWRGKVTEALERVRFDLDRLEDSLRAGGCPAFGGRRDEN